MFVLVHTGTIHAEQQVIEHFDFLAILLTNGLIRNVSVEKFPYAGQNIARRGNTRGYEKTKSSIQKMITNWFLEYKDADMSYIKSYHNHKHGYCILKILMK